MSPPNDPELGIVGVLSHWRPNVLVFWGQRCPREGGKDHPPLKGGDLSDPGGGSVGSDGDKLHQSKPGPLALLRRRTQSVTTRMLRGQPGEQNALLAPRRAVGPQRLPLPRRRAPRGLVGPASYRGEAFLPGQAGRTCDRASRAGIVREDRATKSQTSPSERAGRSRSGRDDERAVWRARRAEGSPGPKEGRWPAEVAPAQATGSEGASWTR